MMFKKDEVVKVKASIPQGPVLSMRFNPDGDVEYLIEWVDANGDTQQRWFLESQLENA